VKINIPPGVDTGSTLRLQGQGGASPRGMGGPAGNLFVRVNVAPDSTFHRSGADVTVHVPVSISQAVLGGAVKVPTLDGEVEIKIPPGTQPETQLVLRSKGIKKLNSRDYGNQYILFKVVVPKNITLNQKHLLEEFAKEEVQPTSFYSRLKDYLRGSG